MNACTQMLLNPDARHGLAGCDAVTAAMNGMAD